MKKLLYIVTMLLNVAGSFCAMSLFVFAGSFCFQNLFLILTGCVVFVTSFTITMFDYKNIYHNPVQIRPVHYRQNLDYREYFSLRKPDFIVS